MREKKKGKKKREKFYAGQETKAVRREKNTRGRWKIRGERTQKGGTEKKERKKGKNY